jgi:sterol desaturase/sphingolipid hydroxylase (fatty acid hydroxylase superfamily)
MDAIAPIVILGSFVAALILERVFPARPLPRVRWWLAKGIAFFVLIMGINGLVPMLVAGGVAAHTPLHLQHLGVLPGALLAFVATQFFSYWIHRAFHRFPALWRWTHQLHHSAERLDVAGAVMFHPFDMIIQTAQVTVTVALLGVSPDAAGLAGMISVFYAIFQHLNMRTPRWIGWLIQRPESHSIHHGRGVHAYNYADFPVIDLLFGTYRNPEGFNEQCGFWDGASTRVGAMLVGRDVGERLRA